MRFVWLGIPIALAAAGALALTLWLRADPVRDIQPRVDVAGLRSTHEFEAKFPGEFLASDVKAPTDLAGSWPNFRGPNYDGVSPEEVPLARQWPPDGPKKLWTVPVGVGYAGAAIRDGRVFILDYDAAKQADTLRCLSLADGREIWRRWYEIPIDSDHGVSRTIPAVTDRCVVTIGPKLHVMCVETATGSFRWGIDMAKEYKTKWPNWYAGQCPLIDRERLILAPAGQDVLMVGLDVETGKVLWQTPNRHAWKMTHSSIIPMEFGTKRMYLYCGSGGIVAVAAEEGDGVKPGDILWERDDWQVPFANVPSPVVLGGGHILLAGGYGGGSMLLKLRDEPGGKIATDIVWRFTKSREFAAEQQTPVARDGYVYAVLPKDAGSLAEQLVCIDGSGKHVWESGRQDRFGLCPFMIADGLIFIMNEEGTLAILEATSDGYKPLAKAKVFDGGAKEPWAPMAMAGGRLIVRDLTRMICLDVRQQQ